ncbi:MAG: hypothetical protein ABIK10_01660 [candidate division WOR-3 bacterium]
MRRWLGPLMMLIVVGRCDWVGREEAKVFRTIKTAARAVEKENLDKISKLITEEYQDSWGHNREELLDFLTGIFYRYNQIKIKLVKNSIVLSENKAAICDLNVWVTLYDKYSGEFEYWQERVLVYLNRVQGQWKITYVAKYSSRTEEPVI